MIPFLKLEDYLAPPPFPAIIAVLMVLGFLYLARRLVSALYPESPGPLPTAACFIIVAALVAAAVHLLAFLKLAYLWPLRIMACSLLLLGILELSKLRWEKVSHIRRRLLLVFEEQSFWGRAALVLLGLTLLGLALAALGPASDEDSIHYHLGVPLEVLRHHGAFPRLDWLYPRLTGLGESLNMLGLAGGTDILGSCLQIAGLLVLLRAITALAGDNFHLIWLAMFVLGCPVVAWLALSQKPQMLPLAGTTIAIIMIARRFAAIDFMTLMLAFGCVFFAMACKLSFLLTGPLVVAAGLVAAYRAGRLGLAVGVALAAYLILVFPVHLQNYLFYGDPISPFLERFRLHGDPEIMAFASVHREYVEFSGSSLLLPLKLAIPESMQTMIFTLGLGAWLILGVMGKFREPGPHRVILGCAVLAVVAILALGQMAGRYFLEPYLWLVAAAALAAWVPGKRWLFRVMVCQMLIMALITGYCALTFFPAALTAYRRHNFMNKSVLGYAETRWLDKVLSPDAVILTEFSYVALLPRPFLLIDEYSLPKLKGIIQTQKVRPGVNIANVNTLVASLPVEEEIRRTLGPALAETLAGPQAFRRTRRNPWRKGEEFQIMVYRLHLGQAPEE